MTVSGLAPTVAILHPEPTDELDVHGLAGNDHDRCRRPSPPGAIAARASTAAPATTRSPAARASRRCSAATATTRSTATEATTWRCSVPVTTPSSGIRATAATRSRARTAPTRCASTAPTSPSRSTCPRTETASASSASRPTSRWTPHGVEQVDFNALGGADLVTVNDLTGTDVSDVNIDLAGTLGGGNGDGQPDQVVINATNGDDTINVSGDSAAGEGERTRADGQDPPPGGERTSSTSTPSPARTRSTPTASPPVQSSSSWTECPSRREIRTESRGPPSRRPPIRLRHHHSD